MKTLNILTLGVLLLFSSLTLTYAESFSKIPRPRLVVVLAIDQCRNDYLTRFEHLFLPEKLANGRLGGFRFFLNQGAVFLNTQTRHAVNTTAPGHATMLTGALPYLHGIVSNAWYIDNKKNYCVGDPTETLVTANPADSIEENYSHAHAASPRNLLVTTVGDELKNTLVHSKVVSVALKDRAAVLMGGHRADLALWFDEKSDGWVTSSFYIKDKKELQWLNKWNQSDYREKQVPKIWKKLLKDQEYSLSTKPPLKYIPDKLNGYTRTENFGKTFPHPLPKDTLNFLYSPWGSKYTLDAALLAAKQYNLGADEYPDLLTISLSSHDSLGHSFGLMSEEMQDMTLREDIMISDFLNQIIKTVPGGMKNIVFVLTGDHGITSALPGYAEDLKLPGKPYWEYDMLKQANDFLKTKFNFKSDDEPVIAEFETNIFIDEKLLEKRKIEVTEVSQELVKWLQKKEFILAAYTRDDLLSGKIPPTVVAKKMAVSTHPIRTGHVFYSARPGHEELENKFAPKNKPIYTGSSHENPTAQDANIPLIFVGTSFKKGHYWDKAFLNDLAPTLSAVLKITPPSGSEGSPLVQAIK